MTGCVVGEESAPAPAGKMYSALRPELPVPNNGLVLDVDLSGQLPITGLGTRADDGTVTVSPAVATTFAGKSGHALLKYAAICALPITDALVIGDDRFDGYYGLAPAWETGACDASCQRWVSACILAHANKEGTPVQISIRGAHPAFTWEPEIVEAHTYQEAAYYGNLFQRELFACVGTSTFERNGMRNLNGRVCGLNESCGLTNLGACSQVPLDVEFPDQVCDRASTAGEGYSACHFRPDETNPRTSAVIGEVVTVYLAP
jgi:hypothetical protein